LDRFCTNLNLVQRSSDWGDVLTDQRISKYVKICNWFVLATWHCEPFCIINRIDPRDRIIKPRILFFQLSRHER
jgi:hypothetical protein